MEKQSPIVKFRALMATGRVANLPTVWSNVIVGFWLVWDENLLGSFASFSSPYIAIPILCFTTSLLYVGGCMLGDYRDIDFDKKNRPTRPIPSGVLSANTVANLSYAFIIIALALAVLTVPFLGSQSAYLEPHTSNNILDLLPTNPPAFLAVVIFLFGAVLLYAYLHKKMKKLALVNMAACRFMLVIFAAAVSFITLNYSYPTTLQIMIAVGFASAVAIYTFLLSSVASTESTPEHYPRRKALALIWFLLPFACLTCHFREGLLIPLIIAFVIYIAWGCYTFKALKTSKPTFVSRALAGFCLLDACYAATISPVLAIICLALFLLALLLQRVAPAT